MLTQMRFRWSIQPAGQAMVDQVMQQGWLWISVLVSVTSDGRRVGGPGVCWILGLWLNVLFLASSCQRIKCISICP